MIDVCNQWSGLQAQVVLVVSAQAASVLPACLPMQQNFDLRGVGRTPCCLRTSAPSLDDMS